MVRPIPALLVATALLFPAAIANAEEPQSAWPAPLAAKSLLLDIEPWEDGLLAVGERGHVLRSPDGVEWTQVNVPTRRFLCAAETVDDLAWLVGYDGIILHGGPDGSWSLQRLEPEEEAPLFDVWFEDPRHGIAVGAYGTFLETFDGGASWDFRDLDEEGPHFFSIAEAEDGVLYLGGEFGTLLRSDDRGETWTRLASPYGGSFFGILPTRDGALLGYGLRGTVFRSTDGGANFQRIATPTTAGLLAGLQRRDGTIVMVGLSGAILFSRDDGLSFRAADREDRVGMSALLERPDGRLLAVGEQGILTLDLQPVPTP